MHCELDACQNARHTNHEPAWSAWTQNHNPLPLFVMTGVDIKSRFSQSPVPCGTANHATHRHRTSGHRPHPRIHPARLQPCVVFFLGGSPTALGLGLAFFFAAAAAAAGAGAVCSDATNRGS